MRLTRLTLLLIAGILALGFVRLCDFLLRDVESQTLQATEETMVDAAHLFATAAELHLEEGAFGSEISEFFEETFSRTQEREFEANIFVKQKTTLSLGCYLTNKEGRVVFDSAQQRLGEDYSTFNDVLRTQQGDYGARSTRADESDASSSIMYVGAPIRYQDELVGVATVYKAQSELLPFVEMRRSQILNPTIAIAIAILFLIWSVLFWLYRPIGRLADFARRITVGERPQFPLLGKGQEVNALGKALRDMREALEGRSYVANYTQTLTHELKSPLAAIRGSAELLDEEMPREERHRFLTNICTEVERSERMINRLLHLSTLEGKTQLQKLEKIDLKALASETIELIDPQAKVKGVTTKLILPPKEIRLTGDYYILRAALENLLQNALDFTPEGSVIEVHLSTFGKELTISVKDEGPGFPHFALEKAFDRFYSHRPKESSTKGSGLGLTFVREAAQLHGGHATIENHAKGGAVVAIHLPFEESKRGR